MDMLGSCRVRMRWLLDVLTSSIDRQNTYIDRTYSTDAEAKPASPGLWPVKHLS
jgi:hypothetical protein